MSRTKYTVKMTTQFKKDFKLATKRGLKMELLEKVISTLAMGEELPEDKIYNLSQQFFQKQLPYHDVLTPQ